MLGSITHRRVQKVIKSGQFPDVLTCERGFWRFSQSTVQAFTVAIIRFVHTRRALYAATWVVLVNFVPFDADSCKAKHRGLLWILTSWTTDLPSLSHSNNQKMYKRSTVFSSEMPSFSLFSTEKFLAFCYARCRVVMSVFRSKLKPQKSLTYLRMRTALLWIRIQSAFPPSFLFVFFILFIYL